MTYSALSLARLKLSTYRCFSGKFYVSASGRLVTSSVRYTTFFGSSGESFLFLGACLVTSTLHTSAGTFPLSSVSFYGSRNSAFILWYFKVSLFSLFVNMGV